MCRHHGSSAGEPRLDLTTNTKSSCREYQKQICLRMNVSAHHRSLFGDLFHYPLCQLATRHSTQKSAQMVLPFPAGFSWYRGWPTAA